MANVPPVSIPPGCPLSVYCGYNLTELGNEMDDVTLYSGKLLISTNNYGMSGSTQR